MSTSDQAGPRLERFREGWVVVDRSGSIATPTPMSEDAARGYARALGMEFPATGAATPETTPTTVAVTQAATGAEPAIVVPGCAGGAALGFLTFVHELADCVDTWQRMRTEHVPTADGLCAARVCGRGGTGIAYLRWPCPTRALADWARRAHRTRSRQEPGTPRSG